MTNKSPASPHAQPTSAEPTDPSVALAHARKNLGESREPNEILTESERDQTERYKNVSGGA
jgi:hypothetical protein